MNKNSLRQIIVAEMILADVNGGDRASPKKRSLFEMMDDSYLAELEDDRLAHSMKTVEELFEATTEEEEEEIDPNGYTASQEANASEFWKIRDSQKPPPAGAPETGTDGRARLPSRIIKAPNKVSQTDVETAIPETDKQRKARIERNRKDSVLSVEEEEELKDKVGEESIDLALTIAGVIGSFAGTLFAAPTGGVSLVVGAIPDIINGIRKVNRGEYVDGVLDFICAIPAIGEGAAVIKALNKVEKIAKFIEIGNKIKNLAKVTRFIKKFIKKIISNFVSSDRKAGAEAAFNDILSGDQVRIKRAISATGPTDDPVPEPVAKLGGLAYLNSLAQEELDSKKQKSVVESKRASRLSLVGALYSN
jgi:hypothetical protein